MTTAAENLVTMADFTPTETLILLVLRDGLPHKRAEIHACLPDELGALKNICQHISNIRKKLRPVGQDILCVARQKTYFYQQVRLLSSANSGRV